MCVGRIRVRSVTHQWWCLWLDLISALGTSGWVGPAAAAPGAWRQACAGEKPEDWCDGPLALPVPARHRQCWSSFPLPPQQEPFWSFCGPWLGRLLCGAGGDRWGSAFVRVFQCPLMSLKPYWTGLWNLSTDDSTRITNRNKIKTQLCGGQKTSIFKCLLQFRKQLPVIVCMFKNIYKST